MALSNDLINQFVKLTNQEEKPKETTVNGTYKVVNGEEFVQLDGSEIWTPVTSTVEAETGERVKVTIKNHTATVTGNISSPSARSKSVKDLKDEVDEQGNTIKEIDNTIERQGNSIIQINNDIQQVNNTISQHDNAISQHGNTIQQINNTIEQQGNDITQLNNDIEQQGNDITQINNTITQHGNTITQHGNIIEQQGNTISQQGNTISQQGNVIEQQGNTIKQHGTELTTINSDISILNSAFVIEDGVLTGLSEIVVDELETNTLNAKYANIDFTNINFAAVRKVFSDSGIIKDLVVQSGKITGELVGVTIKGDLIEGNTVKAEKLVVKGEDGLYYKLNIDGLDNISTTQASKFTLLTETPSDWSTNYTDYYTVSNNKYVHVSGNSAPTWAANTYYKLNSEHQNGLDGTVIIAKSVTADKVQVSDLVAFDATIGGFHIGDHSLYSGVKSSVSNTTRGIYMDDSGQFNIGDSNNFIKYFLDTSDNTYKLNISAGVIHMGGSNKTLQQTIDEIEENMDNMEIGGRNLLQYTAYDKTTSDGITVRGSYATLTIVSDDKPNGVKNKTLKMVTGGSAVTGTKDIWQKCWNNQIYGKSLKLSLYVKGSVAAKMSVRLAGGASDKSSYDFKHDVTTSWDKLEIDLGKVTLSGTSGQTEIIYGFNAAGTFYINSMKLEYGDKYTDWTPAPEDVDSAIAKTVKTVDVEYYLSTSSSSATGGSWTTTAPAWVDGKYMWSRQKVTYVDNTTATRNATCIAGATGNTGGTGATGTGIDSITEEYYLSSSKSTQSDGSWVTTPPTWSSGKYIWTRSKIVYKNPASTAYTTPICSSEWEAVNEIDVGGRNLLIGTKTQDTTKGNQQNSVTFADQTYMGCNVYKSNLAWADIGFSLDRLLTNNTVKVGDTLTYSIYAKSDDDTERELRFYCSSRVDGATKYYYAGKLVNSIHGAKVKNGYGWVKYYYTFDIVEEMFTDEREIVISTRVECTTGTNTDKWIYYAAPKLEFGNKATDWTPAPEDVDDAIAKTVKTVDVEYYLSTSSNSATGGSWTTTAPAWVDGKYMWSRQKVTYVDNTTATRNETCIAGATGATGPTGATGGTGATGATGTGVDSITEEFYLSTSKTTQTGGSWVTTPPTWSSGKYIWTRSKIIYKNPSSTVYTTPLCSSEWEAVNEVEIGGRNLILRSDTFEKSSETWSIGNGITIQDSDINNVKEITMSRTGATGDTWNRAIPHRYLTIDEINQNSKGVLVSFDLKIDDISSIDHGCICALQIFNSSNSRIGWFEGASIISGDLYNTKLSEFTNGVWKRVCVRFSQQDLKRVTLSGHTVDEVAYTSISFQLVRNGSIHIRCPKMEFGDKATDWTPAPEDFQNAISDVSKSISEVIVGTQTASTGSWTGVASFDSLSDGQQITYWLPYAGSGNATLNLTLSNGTKTGPIPCYYQGASRLTTHYPAGSVIHLTYRVNANVNGTNYTGWWGDANYDSNNTNLLRFQQKIKVLEAISAGQIITGTSTGYKKLAVNVSFDLDKPILVASSTLVANATGDNNYIVRPDVNIRTTNGNGSWTATQYEVLYLVGTISGNTFTPTSPFLTTTKPTSESNLYYISLGYMYSTYQIILYPEHPIFKYIDGQFKNISQIAYEAFTSEVGGTNRLIGSSIYREDTPAGFVDEVRNDANKTLPQMQFIPIPDEFYVIQVKTDLPISNAHGYNSNTIGKFTLCFYIRNTGSTKSWGQYDSAICFSSADNSTTKRYLGSKNNNTYYWLYKIPSNAMDVCIRINTYADSNNPITGNFWDFKIEQGNKATDWSPPPEDIDSSIGDAQTVALDAKSAVDVVKDVANQASVDIESIKGYIQNLVVDQNGQSMMTQTGKGWQFNMGTINGNLNSLSKAVDDMSNDNEDTKALLDNVKSLAESVADKTAYINVDYTIDASGNPIPRMILGAETSAFKIRITNESIDFMESDTVMAYATSNTFYNLTTVVQKELQIGSGPAYIWSVRANGNMGLTYKSNSAIS